MKDVYIILGIFCVCIGVLILLMLYLVFKLDDITNNIEDRFIYFNEELVILADVLKDYRDFIDNDNNTIPLKYEKISNW